MGKYSEYSQEILQELSNKYTNCTFDFQLVELNVCISVFFVLVMEVYLIQLYDLKY